MSKEEEEEENEGGEKTNAKHVIFKYDTKEFWQDRIKNVRAVNDDRDKKREILSKNETKICFLLFFFITI